MGTPLFIDKTYTGTGEQVPVMLNRWTLDDISIVVDISATATYTIEATLSQLNRDDGLTAIWFEVSGLIGLTADVTDKISATPLQAVRVNIAANSGNVRFQVMQSGVC